MWQGDAGVRAAVGFRAHPHPHPETPNPKPVVQASSAALALAHAAAAALATASLACGVQGNMATTGAGFRLGWLRATAPGGTAPLDLATAAGPATARSEERR